MSLPHLSVPPLPERYELRERIDGGAMGELYRALDREADREVAIKCVPPDASPAARERLAREASLAARVSHPGVIEVYDSGDCWIAMRLIDGVRFDSATNWMPRDQRIDLMREVTDAAGAIHAAGVVHGDLKPGNILVDESGRPIIVDFGLARAVEDAGPVGNPGTARYMSPQALAGSGPDPRADVWSLGVMLYELLTDAPPFRGAMDSGLFSMIVDDDPEPPREIDPSIPPELEAVALQALDKDASRRYPDATAMTNELDHYRLGTLAQTTQRRRRPLLDERRRRLAVGAGAAIALILAVVCWLVWR